MRRLLCHLQKLGSNTDVGVCVGRLGNSRPKTHCLVPELLSMAKPHAANEIHNTKQSEMPIALRVLSLEAAVTATRAQDLCLREGFPIARRQTQPVPKHNYTCGERSTWDAALTAEHPLTMRPNYMFGKRSTWDAALTAAHLGCCWHATQTQVITSWLLRKLHQHQSFPQEIQTQMCPAACSTCFWRRSRPSKLSLAVVCSVCCWCLGYGSKKCSETF